MITTRCTKCGNETRVPDSIVGKKVRCKDPECGQIYVAVESVDAILSAAPAASGLDSVNPADLFRPSLPEPEWSTPEDAGPRLKRLPSRGSGSTDKYPNLIQYLGYVQSLAVIQLTLSLILAGLLLVVSVVGPIVRNVPFQEAILPILSGLLMSTIIGLIAYVLYVVTMAGVEFVKVIMDIEANTRRMASQSGD